MNSKEKSILGEDAVYIHGDLSEVILLHHSAFTPPNDGGVNHNHVLSEDLRYLNNKGNAPAVHSRWSITWLCKSAIARALATISTVRASQPLTVTCLRLSQPQNIRLQLLRCSKSQAERSRRKSDEQPSNIESTLVTRSVSIFYKSSSVNDEQPANMPSIR